MASKPQAFDPMEKAFHQAHAQLGQPPHSEPLREYGFTSGLRAMSVARAGADGAFEIATKGAPEAVAALCGLNDAQRAEMLAAIDQLAARGLRVLAVARARHSGELPASQTGFDLQYLGLVGLADPLRAEIPDAVRQCKEAGIRVLVITGDYPVTALAIAREAGLAAGEVLNGDQLASMSDAELARGLRNVAVCARITPDQKLRIVEALKRQGEVVAMTGDGVNDAPALKAAHVGIAMGARGTDVAREAAAMVLLDDNFASIVRGIRLGRRFFANMQNAMSYVMATHVPIAGMAMLPVLFGLPVLLMPMHISFLELIISPACSLAFENESSESGIMSHPPRDVAAPLFERRILLVSLLQGLGAFAMVALAYLWALHHLGETQARAFGFTTLVVANVTLILASLSPRRPAWRALISPNRIPVLVALGALSTLGLALYWPWLTRLFRFAPLTAGEFLLAVAMGGACVLWFDALKWLARTRPLAARQSG
jgi:Ca2+-transporting ATPase